MSVRLKTLCLITCLSLLTAAEGIAAFTTGLSVKALYDDNLYLQDEAPLAVGQTVAALPAKASAFITDLGINLRWTGKYGSGQQIDAGYTPELFRYSRYQTENHTDHRFTINATGKIADHPYEAKTSWLSTDGSHDSPVFNRLGGGPPVGTEPVRARRAQDIFKFGAQITHPFQHTFVRGVVSVYEQDFHTKESLVAGCANYVDRSEWLAGGDLGWKATPAISLVATARVGRQGQADLLGVPLNYTNTVTRWLVGAEGTLGPKLKFSALVGPSSHHFGPSVRAGFNRHQTTTYVDTSLTWATSTTDTIRLTTRRFLWFGSSGRSVYLDTQAELNWQHQFSSHWSFNTCWSHHEGDVTRYNPASPRDDWVRAIAGTITHSFDAKSKIEVGISQDWSHSFVTNTPAREYHRRIYHAGVTRTW